MKTAITVRLDPALLAAVREGAERENRSLTNFIETSLKEHIRISQAFRLAQKPVLQQREQ